MDVSKSIHGLADYKLSQIGSGRILEGNHLAYTLISGLSLARVEYPKAFVLTRRPAGGGDHVFYELLQHVLVLHAQLAVDEAGFHVESTQELHAVCWAVPADTQTHKHTDTQTHADTHTHTDELA